MQVLPWESSVPTIGHDPSVGFGFVAPGEGGLIESTARRVLPLRLVGKPYAGPVGVCQRVFVSHMHDGMQLASVQRRGWTLRMPPIRAWHPTRPPGPIIEGHRRIRGCEDK